MPKCKHCHQPQTAALVVCPECYRALTERTENVESDKLIAVLLAKAKVLDEKATPGPWMWEIRTNIHDCKLMTAHSGQYYVMDFERWGMQDACPRLQVYERYSGPVTERGSKGMERADKMARSYHGKEHHKGFDDYIDHPDAEFIAESRALLPALIGAVEALTAQLTEKGTEIDRLSQLVLMREGEIGDRDRELAEKDKQLGAAVEDLKFIMRHSGERAVCKLCTHNCIINSRVKPKYCDAVWRGAQGAGEGGG